jgi:HEAT repeat protein
MWHLSVHGNRLVRHRAGAVALAAGLLVLLWGGAAPAQSRRGFAPDPVEELHRALLQDREAGTPAALAYREKNLAKYADRIRTLGDLGRALMLREWGLQSLDFRVQDVDRKVWLNLAQRFGKQAKDALENGTPEEARAAATMVAEMATLAQTAGIRSGDVEERLASFTPYLRKLTESPDPALRTSAVRALGTLGLQANKALPTLERTLKEDGVPQRRAAAEALINLIRLAAQSEREGGGGSYQGAFGLVPPTTGVGNVAPPVGGGALEQRPMGTGGRGPADRRSPTTEAGIQTHNVGLIDMSKEVVPVAGVALNDSDAEVRRLGVEAIQQAAQNLTDSILLPVSLDFPPAGRPLAPEERAHINEYRDEVKGEVKLLTPLMESLKDQGEGLARVARDPNPAVRITALRTLEQMGYAREKLIRRYATMPPAPKESETLPAPTPRDNSKEKSELPGAAGGTLVAQVAPAAAPLPARDVLPRDPLLAGLRESLPSMIRALSDPDVRARLAAIDALEMLGDQALSAVPALTRALGDPDLFVRWAAARTLGKMVPADEDTPVPGVLVAAVPEIARLLCDPDLDLRLAAATALGRFGPAARDAVPALAQTVNKGDVEIRVAAIEALGNIGPDAAPAIPAVIEALSHSDPRVRSAAAHLLGRFGPTARQAAGPLRALLTDPDPEVRRAASDAILSILERQ